MLKDEFSTFSSELNTIKQNVEKDMKKSFYNGNIAVIDGHSLIFRYALGMPEFFSSEGIQVNGLFGFCSLILKMIKQKTFDNIVIAFDKCKKNFRKDILVSYKANRTKDMSHVMLQIELAIEFCKSANIINTVHENYEADDIIATYIDKNPTHKFTVLSLDKDLLQILDKSNRVQIFNPFTKIYTKYDDVYKKYSVYPEDFALFLALCGDSSDNIPGIKGVGPKTAAKIIESGIHNSVNLFPKYNFSDLDLMLSLTKLCVDVPIEHMILENTYNFDNIRTFLKVMSFDSLNKI